MRTHTLFAIALASFLIHFSEAATVAPVDGVLATVVPGGTGSLVGTAAGLVAPAPGPSSARKKKRSELPLTGVAGLGTVSKKRGLVDGLLGGGGGGGGGSSRGDRSDDRHGDRWDDEVTKRSNIQERDLLGGVLGGGGNSKKGTASQSGKKASLLDNNVLPGLVKRDLLGGGLPVVGGLLGGGGKSTKKNTVKQAAVTGGKGSRARKPSSGRGRGRGRGRARNQKVQPAATKASGGGDGLLGGGGLPVVGGILG